MNIEIITNWNDTSRNEVLIKALYQYIDSLENRIKVLESK